MLAIPYMVGIAVIVVMFGLHSKKMTERRGQMGALIAFGQAYALLFCAYALAFGTVLSDRPDCFPEDTVSALITFALFYPQCSLSMAFMEPLEPWVLVMCLWSLPIFVLVTAFNWLRARTIN
jgi:hypothetical protein